MIFIITLTKGRVAFVDEADFYSVNQFDWCLHSHGYAVRQEVGKMIFMHRQIMNASSAVEIDHINGNKSDNRRINLRFVDRIKQCWNSSSHRGSSSRFKGVYWSKDRQKWIAQITVYKHKRNLGGFDSETDAAEAYNQEATKHFGEYARLNDISEDLS